MSESAFKQQMDEITITRQVAGPPCLQAVMSSAVAAINPCRPKGILVIEDERLLRKVVEQVLRKHGFAVWVAANGAEGVDLYRRVAAQIDVVLSDVQMPVLDGPKTLDALREINPSVRCCFMTGDTRPTRLAQLLGQCPAGLLIKPLEHYEVVAVLKKVADQTAGNVEMGGNSNGGDNRDSPETRGGPEGDDVGGKSHKPPVSPLLRAFAALISLGEEWSAGLK